MNRTPQRMCYLPPGKPVRMGHVPKRLSALRKLLRQKRSAGTGPAALDPIIDRKLIDARSRK